MTADAAGVKAPTESSLGEVTVELNENCNYNESISALIRKLKAVK